jgi:CRISPR-associated protein Csb2
MRLREGTPVSSMHALVLQVRWHGDRLRAGEPPSPGRLFHALVAGSYPWLTDRAAGTLRWLERLDAPVLAASLAHPGDSEPSCLYAWHFPLDDDSAWHAQQVCALMERVGLLERGIERGWGRGEILTNAALERRLWLYPGRVLRPARASGRRGQAFSCPTAASFDRIVRSLTSTQRFTTLGAKPGTIEVLARVPRPHFVQRTYAALPTRGLFALQSAWPLRGASLLITRLRDAAAEQLYQTLPASRGEIELALIGRNGRGRASPAGHRIRLLPLPSLGSLQKAPEIRHLLVVIPQECHIPSADVFCAFSGLELASHGDGANIALVPTEDADLFELYGVETRPHRTWRTVTAAALPRSLEQQETHESISFAVSQALRHEGVRVPATAVRVQREPFETRGERAEAFAPETRFPKERLWHVEVSFAEPVSGPLAIGDGRFLGLGVMVPGTELRGIFAFVVEGGLSAWARPELVAHAFRRAVMARVQAQLGSKNRLMPYFCGHQEDGSPATQDTPHLAFSFAPHRNLLLVLAPHARDHRIPSPREQAHLQLLSAALAKMHELKAGAAGSRYALRGSIWRPTRCLRLPVGGRRRPRTR